MDFSGERTTKYLEIAVKQTGFNEYAVMSKNVPMPLPIDILTSQGTNRIIITDRWVKMKSSFSPVIDPNGYFLKVVTSN